MRLLIIDNYDSFTFNLYQLAAEVFETEPVVVANDADWNSIQFSNFDAVILSPGPGRPDRPADFGISSRVIAEFQGPILGVCLGHQGICAAFGARMLHAPEPMHGRVNAIHHDGSELFHGIPDPFDAVRYHSLRCEEPLPEGLRKTAWAADGTVMGVAHHDRPLWGVQFHPESISTPYGRRLLENFRDMADQRRTWKVYHRRAPLEMTTLAMFETLFAAEPYSFWLEGGRFSFLGGSSGSCRDIRYRAGDPFDLFAELNSRLAGLRVDSSDLPFDFTGGYVGYFGYELKALCGARDVHRSQDPDCYLQFVDRFVAVDGHEKQCYLVFAGTGEDAEAWFAGIATALKQPREAPRCRSTKPAVFSPIDAREEYLAKVERCREALLDGESYEICLTTRFEAQTDVDPFDYYRVLRDRNPAPHSAFLRFPEVAAACSSPEQFLKITRDGVVETKPIKGTLRRSADAADDNARRRELASDTKSRSEHLMIVDLLRNDLGKVCEIGSVTVPSLMHVESYATVHQLVSTIRGQLRHDRTVVDCLRTAFPGGSMTGAPKRRTMEILDALEGRARGIYSGSIGYLSFSGAADLNIVIRTAVFSHGRASIGSGGAVIALSEAEDEWNETLLKAEALISAFDETGLR